MTDLIDKDALRGAVVKAFNGVLDGDALAEFNRDKWSDEDLDLFGSGMMRGIAVCEVLLDAAPTVSCEECENHDGCLRDILADEDCNGEWKTIDLTACSHFKRKS